MVTAVVLAEKVRIAICGTKVPGTLCTGYLVLGKRQVVL